MRKLIGGFRALEVTNVIKAAKAGGMEQIQLQIEVGKITITEISDSDRSGWVEPATDFDYWKKKHEPTT